MSQQNQKHPNEDCVDRVEALFSMSVGLLSEVTPPLRAASIKWDDESVQLFFYYDGEISEDEIDSISCVSTEVIASFSENIQLKDDVILRIDYPKPIPHQGELVYYRKEPMSPAQRAQLYTRYPSYKGLDSQNHIEEILTLNRALWGRVSPQLRKAVISWNNRKGLLVFYYDGKISEEDRQLSESVRNEFLDYYPDYELQLEIIRLDLPHWLPRNDEERPLYRRRESL